MQSDIDRGLMWCEPCNSFGYHTFCGGCGQRYFGRELTWRKCKCGGNTTTDFCPFCGALMASARRRAFERGELDLQAASDQAARIMESFFGERSVTIASEPEREPAALTSLKSAVMQAFAQGGGDGG